MSKTDEFRKLIILIGLVPFAVLPRCVSMLACRALAAFLMRRGSSYPENLAAILPVPLAPRMARTLRAALRRAETLGHYDRVLVWRAVLFPRWRRCTTIEGIEHLERALIAGRGVILWVHPCVSSNVAVKQALCEAGHPLVHLTRPGHAFSSSPLGVRVVSPILRRSESPYLAERVVIDAGSTVGPLRQLRRRLAENRVVSITVTVTASQLAQAQFLDGELSLPVGPIELAVSTGAALLPVFTQGDPARPEVHIGAPLPVAGNRREAVATCVPAAARWLEEYALLYPECWVGWRQGLFRRQ